MDPENSLGLMETNLPTPKNARVYVNLLEGKSYVSIDKCLHHEEPSRPETALRALPQRTIRNHGEHDALQR